MNKSQLDMYKENQEALLKEYKGKIVVIKDGECIQSFDNFVEAFRMAQSKGYKEGEYLIVECSPGNSAYTAFFANSIGFNGSCHAS